MERVYKNRLWTEELCNTIRQTKGMTPKEAYDFFIAKHPDKSNITKNAVSRIRSRLKCSMYVVDTTHSSMIRPLYSESSKHGYVRIKIAQPNVWMQKQKWVYLETHPEEYNLVKQTDAFYFLDGDKHNFHPDNIIRVERSLQLLFAQHGGIVKGNPKQSKINYLLAKHKKALLDYAEKKGLVSIRSGRTITEDYKKRQKEYNSRRYHTDEAFREKQKAYAKKHRLELKNNPALYEEYKIKHREYCREYARRKREEEKKRYLREV